MQRRIFRLIITDFLCWVPISIMAFLIFSQIWYNEGSPYAIAIFLLPINSVLNPILYSQYFDNYFSKIRNAILNCGGCKFPNCNGSGQPQEAMEMDNMNPQEQNPAPI